ncbi:putative 3',5'-cyclic phosphodiesterase pde-5 [Penaeus vannamei]|uniref:Putative 3',5'-cyclic phosphodiesterase pde-5 n=1 Tax=Penaeus vannamei TaxID=6689 RepID=A0A423SUR9_PENVA|nr:putative 3',5'-cyclic phosphodiesterase pde-5 [Penaeus vannamei]
MRRGRAQPCQNPYCPPPPPPYVWRCHRCATTWTTGRKTSSCWSVEPPGGHLHDVHAIEHHHFNQTVTILQQEGHNIFGKLTSNEYKQVLGNIKHCILATDLAMFFPNKAKLAKLVEENQFDWENPEHRLLIEAIAMTACDLCASAKPWDVQVETVKVIFEEFYEQPLPPRLSSPPVSPSKPVSPPLTAPPHPPPPLSLPPVSPPSPAAPSPQSALPPQLKPHSPLKPSAPLPLSPAASPPPPPKPPPVAPRLSLPQGPSSSKPPQSQPPPSGPP